MINKSHFCSTLVLLIVFFVLSSPSVLFSKNIAVQIDPVSNQPEETDSIIHSGPADIKEKTDVLFFLGWVWLSIFVLVYFLRQKIKETDRLHQSGYFPSGKENECQKD